MTPVDERNPAKLRCIRQGTFSLLAGLTFMVMTLASVAVPMVGQVHAESGQALGPINVKRIEGRWVRPDGGYLLELKEIKNDGSLKAAYYNPRPIKVGKAELRRKDGGITLVVELRDVNYPGSTYTLRYDPGSDQLKGTYYQAVEKQTYDVEFVRYRER